MKILVIGGGGREHALVWKLLQSPAVDKIWCAPGNGGIANDAECVPVDTSSLTDMLNLADRLSAELTVIGPELPLVLGLADELRRRRMPVVGPGREAAQLEGSKIYAKEFLARHNIPTARTYGIFESADYAKAALADVKWPVVLKADGLCAGKGVLVTSDPAEANEFIERCLVRGEFGDAGRKVLIEETLQGHELSYIVLTDGSNVIPMAPTHDYKRAYDGDRGPNTGGMGAYSDDALLPPELESRIKTDVVQPTIAGLKKDCLDYRGFLYFGLMITPEGSKVLEYNCRLGDPETQAIMLRADFDLADLLIAAAEGDLSDKSARWKPGASCFVVLAAKGYPDKPELGGEIVGLQNFKPTSEHAIFAAGVKASSDKYYVSGGRVLGTGAFALNLSTATRYSYDVISRVIAPSCRFRSDIGASTTAAISAAADAQRGYR